MKPNNARRLVVAAFVSVALNAAAKAESDPNAAPVAGEAIVDIAVAETAEIASGWRASKLMHAPVYNDNNEEIGKIDDFIVSQDGSLSVAIVDVGGFLNIGEHRIAVPIRQFDEILPKIVLRDATKEALLQLPEFTYSS